MDVFPRLIYAEGATVPVSVHILQHATMGLLKDLQTFLSQIAVVLIYHRDTAAQGEWNKSSTSDNCMFGLMQYLLF